MIKYFKNINQVILNFLIFLFLTLLIISLYSFIQTSIMKKEYANIFGYSIFEVKTGSMSGSIEIGDLVFVNILDENKKNSLKVGDIVSFKDENYIVTHRINEINGENITTKGDANNAVDKAITKDKIIGKVVKVIPKVGIYKKVLLDKKVFILLCLTFSLFFISFSIKNSEEKNNTCLKEEGTNNEIKNKKDKI
jgi:signal peptidase